MLSIRSDDLGTICLAGTQSSLQLAVVVARKDEWMRQHPGFVPAQGSAKERISIAKNRCQRIGLLDIDRTLWAWFPWIELDLPHRA
jgi:hypothetical protein